MIKNKTLIVMVWIVSTVLIACGGGSSNDTSSTNSNEQQDQADQNNADTVKTTPTNQRPTADVSATQQVTSGETVTLDGSDSNDPDGDTLTFSWSQTQGTSLSLGDTANPTLIFIAPSVEQVTTYGFRLLVDDGELSDSATVSVTVMPMVDTIPPAIVARTPQANATDVSVTTTIIVDFDEPLQDSLINDQSLLLSVDSSTLPASVSYDGQNNRLSLIPDNALSAETTYTVTLDGNLQDLAGNLVTSTSWRFTTGSEYNLGQTPQSTIDQCMSTSDKVMLTLINNARTAARSCGTTNYPAVSAVAWNCSLEVAAQGHSTSMADNDFFSHTGLDDASPADRITATGYTWRAYGENIAAGFPDAESAMIAWLDSPGHCVNIMNDYFTEVGAAVATNPASTYGIYWTQDFADSF